MWNWISFLKLDPYFLFLHEYRSRDIDIQDKLKRWRRNENSRAPDGVLKTRCPSYCLRCLRVIPPLVVGLANWLSTPRLLVFGIQFQEKVAFLSVLGKARTFSNTVSLLAHLSGILNFNTSLLEFSRLPLSYKKKKLSWKNNFSWGYF